MPETGGIAVLSVVALVLTAIVSLVSIIKAMSILHTRVGLVMREFDSSSGDDLPSRVDRLETNVTKIEVTLERSIDPRLARMEHSLDKLESMIGRIARDEQGS